jgi:aspartate kinase
MKVLKFGGTSVGSAARMKHVAELTTKQTGKTLLVLSAVSGTTNSLVALSEAYYKEAYDVSGSLLASMKEKYTLHVDELYATETYKQKAQAYLQSVFSLLGSFEGKPFQIDDEKVVLAQGELMSTHMMYYYLLETGFQPSMIPALDYMRTEEGEPDMPFIRENLYALMNQYPDCTLYITQGYICRNEHGKIDNLLRGGSDYTASIVGAAVKAEEIQIWTDIDGMHNNDPRIVDKTYPVHELSFEEAAELAYFGAKILHPSSVLPAQKENIPVRLLNTMDPEAQGTLIASARNMVKKVTAVAAKDGIIAIKIRSSRMLLAYGFLRKVFEIFEKYKTPIDMITTSEVAISLTIDNPTHLDKILAELRYFGMVEHDMDQAIICVVGRFLQEDALYAAKVMDALKHLPIRMISYGGSKYNISVLLHKDYKKQALQLLNDAVFYGNN